MGNDAAWTALVAKKSRALLDGSNLYRQVTIRHDDGREEKVRVSRAVWKQIEVGSRLVKAAGEDPGPA